MRFMSEYAQASALTAVAACALACLMSGCPSKAPERDVGGGATSSSSQAKLALPPEKCLLTIVTNTQATNDDVRIGAGNFHEKDYVDEAGEKKYGKVAALWIFVRGDSTQDRAITVYPGKKFEAGKKLFEMRTVTDRAVNVFVRPNP